MSRATASGCEIITSCEALISTTVPPARAAAANFNPRPPARVDTGNEARGPLLLVMGGKDHTVPEAVTLATLKRYGHSDAVTELREFSDRAHSLTSDSGWREVADSSLHWPRDHDLGAVPHDVPWQSAVGERST